MKVVALCVWVALTAAGNSLADVSLPALFSDHMVLQQGTNCPVWGWATPGEEVTVSIAGQSRGVTTGPDGKWIVRLDPLENGEAHTLTVNGATNGVVVQDVLIGEVWLCAGQSNMEMGLSICNDAAEEIADAEYPLLRMFRVENNSQARPIERCEGRWVVCSPQTVARFSAVAYFFGRELFTWLETPIGLINSSWGGTPIEAWTSLEAVATIDELKPLARLLAGDIAVPVDSRLDKQVPANLFNGMIQPLIPYSIRGAIWYQGESNAYMPYANAYSRQLAAMIKDWRTRWAADFPFAWVQLPEFEPKSEDGRRGWPVIREEMVKALSIPRTGMAVTLGLGDPANVHPKAKQDVGKRLALWAVGEAYGREDIVYKSPLYANHEIRGGEVVITFENTDGGLLSTNGVLEGFAIAGEDRRWFAADAAIDGDTVVVSSAAVPRPAAVRYAWAANPAWSLINGAGLPAAPFRTDSWAIELVPRVERGAQVPAVLLETRAVAGLKQDGQLDDAFWDGLTRHELKRNPPGTESGAATTFKLAWGSDGCFHLGIACAEPDMSSLRIAADTDGDRNIWNGDCIEILLETQTHSYYQVTISPSGAIVDLDRSTGLQYLWQSGAKAAAQRTEEGWTLEVRIPVPPEGHPCLNLLNGVAGQEPSQAAPWFFNLARQRVTDTGQEAYVFSPAASGNYHDTAAFARITAE